MRKDIRILKGRKIVDITFEDFGGFDVPILHLDNGTQFYAVRDGEANGPAALFLNEAKGYYYLYNKGKEK